MNPDALNDTFAYDSASRLLTASSARYANTVSRTYDPAGRLGSETLTVGGTPYITSYGYSADNLQTDVIYPGNHSVARTFTARHQLASVSYDGVSVATHGYDDGMRLATKSFNNGLAETRSYRPDNLASGIATPGVTTFGYSWDANKRKLTQTETGIPLNNQDYGYDNEDRVTAFNRNNGDSQTWALSLVGDWNTFTQNGVQQTRTHNEVHELTRIDAARLIYDRKGNLLIDNDRHVYTWDYENRLAHANIQRAERDAKKEKGPPPARGHLAIYTYDALGRRVSKTWKGDLLPEIRAT